MRSKVIIAMMLAASTTAVAQKTTVLTPDKANGYGLVYTLPTTGLQVTVSATKTTETPGAYYKYANRYIGTPDVISEPKVIWTVDAVTVSAYGVADPSRQYLMQLKPGQPISLCVDADGMLLAVNAEVDPEAAATAKVKKNPFEKKEKIDGKGYLQYVTSDFLASQSSAKQAQMLAESLMEVREARLSLTRGTADNMPSDGRQLELMLNSLKDQESTFTRAFTGYTETETAEQTFTYLPQASGRKVLFRIGSVNGFTTPDDLSGEPVYIEISDIKTAEVPLEEGKERKLPKDGVVYSLPGSALVSISYKGDKLWEGRMEMSQFGTVFALPPTIFTDKKAPQYAIFNPATGALVETGNAE